MGKNNNELIIIVDTENINLEMFISKTLELNKQYLDYDKKFVLPFNERDIMQKRKERYLNFISAFTNNIILKKIKNSSKNALDFYICTLIGTLVNKSEKDLNQIKIIIFSNDTDFELIKEYYKMETDIDIEVEKIKTKKVKKRNISILGNTESKSPKEFTKHYLHKKLPCTKGFKNRIIFSHINGIFTRIKNKDHKLEDVLNEYEGFRKKYKNRLKHSNFTDRDVEDLYYRLRVLYHGDVEYMSNYASGF